MRRKVFYVLHRFVFVVVVRFADVGQIHKVCRGLMLYRQGDYKLVTFVRKIAAAVVDIIYFVLVILNLVVEQKVGRFFFKPCKKAFRNVDEIIGVDDIFYRVFASYDNGRGDAGIRNLVFKIFIASASSFSCRSRRFVRQRR